MTISRSTEPGARNAPSEAAANVRFSFLGTTLLERMDANTGEKPIFASGKPLALLAFLSCSPGHSASREQLIELLWADVEGDGARHTLRQTLWYVRRKVGFDPFSGTGDVVRLASAIPSDRATFLAALDADDPELAIQLYGGEFFPDFAAPGGAAFEQWADLERARLRGMFVGAATQCVRARLGKGKAREATSIARRVHELAPRQQAAWRLLLESYLAANDVIGATVELERLERWLGDDELEPDPATSALMKATRSGSALSGANGTSRESFSETSRLASELVGRESEFSALLGALEATKRGQSRHVHISAPAGFGKTRLLDGFAARLRSSRARIISVRATPAERSLPYAFAAHLVAALVPLRGASAVSPDTARTLVALAPAASSFLNAEPDRSAGDEALRRRSLAIVELTSTIAHDAPLVVLVDDVHWMDTQSRTLLSSLAGRLGNASVLLVTSARPNDRFADDISGTKRLTLAPLSVDDIGALVMSIGQLPVDPWADVFIQALESTSKGSPLLVMETLQLGVERQQLHLNERTWSSPDPDALVASLGAGRALQERLSLLPSIARDVLLRLSVAGIGINDASLPHILPFGGHESMTLLETRGLIMRVDDSWRVAHDEIADALIGISPNADREEANLVIAAHLEQTAENEMAVLLRAAWHRARAADTAGLDRVFARAVINARLSGEHAAIRALGREVLGASAATEEIDRLVRRLPWRARRHSRAWILSSLTAATVIAVIGMFLANQMGQNAPIDLMYSMETRIDGRTEFLGLRRVTDDLATDSPIDLILLDAPLPRDLLDSITISGRLADGTFVGSVLTKDSARGMDVVRVTSKGTVSSLLAKPHDQSSPIVSPDGRRILYSTGEFHAVQRSELALFDPDRDSSVRLTESDAREDGPRFDAMGTRVAYVRTPATPVNAEVCWTTTDRTSRSCQVLPDSLIATSIVGWRSESELLVLAERRESPQQLLLLLHLSAQRIELLDVGGAAYVADPSGRMVACVCRVAGYQGLVAAVFSPGSPTLRRVLRYDGKPIRSLGANFFVWEPTGDALAAVQARGPDAAAVHQRVRFGAVGKDAHGRERSVPLVRWRSLDTSVVKLQESGDGEFKTYAAGRARIVVSASDDITDTVVLIVRENQTAVVLREDWRTSIVLRWIDFGEPVPSLSDGTLRLNGDGHLTTGVVSRIVVDSRRGAGVRARFRLPVNAPQWQSITVALSFFATETQLRMWLDRRRGEQPSSWLAFNTPRHCHFSAPRGEGGPKIRLMSMLAAGETVTMPRNAPTVADGKWHEVVLQVFDDGRCGLAIDQVPLTISENALFLDQPLRVMVDGRSVGTTVEVGPVEAWTGVRSGIDWGALDARVSASIQ